MGGPTSTRVYFEDHWLDTRTRDMIIAARVICKAPMVITQGSYNTSVSQSAGTHAGGGAVDIRLKDRTPAERIEIMTCMRKVGFAAWIRNPSQGDWPWHCHGIAIGCPDLSSGARSQVTAYKNGRNGLANNGADDGPRAYVSWTWEKYKQTYPDLLTEDEMTPAQMTELKNFIEARTQAYAAFDAKNTEQQLRTLFTNLETLEQKYAVAVNEFTRQDGDLGENSIIGAVSSLRGEVSALQSALTAVKQDVAGVRAAVEALPKA